MKVPETERNSEMIERSARKARGPGDKQTREVRGLKGVSERARCPRRQKKRAREGRSLEGEPRGTSEREVSGSGKSKEI